MEVQCWIKESKSPMNTFRQRYVQLWIQHFKKDINTGVYTEENRVHGNYFTGLMVEGINQLVKEKTQKETQELSLEELEE